MKTANLLLAVVVVLLLVIAVALWAIVQLVARRASHGRRTFDRVLISRAYDQLKTGDVILFVSRTGGLDNTLFTGGLFTHAGVIIKRPGRDLEIAETCPDGILRPRRLLAGARRLSELKLPGGPAIFPLLTRLRYYQGQPYLMSLSRPLSKAAASRLCRWAEIAAGLTAEDEALPYPGLGDMLAGLLGHPRLARPHCYQHAAALLDAAGLTPLADREAGRFLRDAGIIDVCRRMSRLDEERLPGGYSYLTARELVYDVPE